MSNHIYHIIDNWRSNNSINGLKQTKLLLECFIRYKTFKSGGLNSKLMVTMLPSAANTLTKYIEPSFPVVPRQHNYYRLTNRGKILLQDLEHAFMFNGINWNPRIPKIIQKDFDIEA